MKSIFGFRSFVSVAAVALAAVSTAAFAQSREALLAKVDSELVAAKAARIIIEARAGLYVVDDEQAWQQEMLATRNEIQQHQTAKSKHRSECGPVSSRYSDSCKQWKAELDARETTLKDRSNVVEAGHQALLLKGLNKIQAAKTIEDAQKEIPRRNAYIQTLQDLLAKSKSDDKFLSDQEVRRHISKRCLGLIGVLEDRVECMKRILDGVAPR